MAFCIECCFRGEQDPSQPTMHNKLSNQQSISLTTAVDNPQQTQFCRTKLINGLIPSNLPEPNAPDWDPVKMLKQARYDAIKERSDQIDPNYAFYQNNACFEEKYNHGLYKIAKIIIS